jgi:hypothetical protein
VKNLAYQILAAVLLLAIGCAAGWRAKGVSVAAGQTATARAETQAVVTGVNKQAAAQHADQVAEQGKSVALGAEQAGIRATGDKLQQEIDRAPFTITVPNITIATPATSISCPDDPVGSDDFVRLYNAAARGADPAAAGSAGAR